MKFALDFDIAAGDSPLESAEFLARVADPSKVEQVRAALSDVSAVEGRLVLRVDGQDVCGAYSDPLVRLVDQWLRKLPWIVGGDTETVALRNSEHCFAFVPAAESVEITYFLGTETEIEEYVVEPTTVRLESFVAESIAVGERLVRGISGADSSLLERNEDCRDLGLSLAEAKRCWREYQLHQRR